MKEIIRVWRAWPDSWVKEFVAFGIKEAYATIFGALLLAVIIATRYAPMPPGIHRYDIIFVLAILIQILLILLKLETRREVYMIAVFHVVATVMELFKTSASIGSWTYPEASFFHIWTVPLFAGFMYSAVGSYIARTWRIFHMRFTHYPPMWITYVLSVCIYLNFFSHHYVPDMRLPLMLFAAALYARTWVHFTVLHTERRMPFFLSAFLVAFFIYLAENIATYTHIWLYPSQYAAWHLVPVAKLSSWFLLLIISFVLISVVQMKEMEGVVDRG